MEMKTLFTRVGSAILAGFKVIATAVCTAKIENVIKAGLFVGTAIVSSYLIVKTMRNKVESYQDDSNMSIVDRALALNYTDRRNLQHLDPILKDVKRTISGKNPKKSGRFAAIDPERVQKAARRATRCTNREVYNPLVLSKMEQFEREMEEVRFNDRHSAPRHDVLARVWHEC